MDASVNPHNLHNTGQPVLTHTEYLLCEAFFDFGARHVSPEDLTAQLISLVRQANGSEGTRLQKEAHSFVSYHLKVAQQKEASHALRVLVKLGLSRKARTTIRLRDY